MSAPSFHQLEKALKQVEVPRLVWIHGDELLLSNEACDLLRRHWRNLGFSERCVLAASEITDKNLRTEGQTLSLFAPQRLIELRFEQKPTAAQGAAIVQVLESSQDDLRWLVRSPRLDRKTLQLKWAASLAQQAWLIAIYPVERAQLPQWIAQRLAQQNQQASQELCALIARCVEGNLLAAHQVLLQLHLLFPPGRLSTEIVQSVVSDSAQFHVFEWIREPLQGDADRTLRGLEALRAAGEAELLVLWVLSDALRMLLRIREAQARGEGAESVFQKFRVFRPRDGWFRTALTRRDLDQRSLMLLMEQAAQADRVMKGMETGQAPWLLLSHIALQLSGALPMQRLLG